METTFNLSENSQLTTPGTPDAHSTCSSSTKRIPPVLEIPVPIFFFKGTAFSTSYKVFVDSFTQSLIPNLTRITVFLPCHGQAHCPLIDMSPFCRLPLKSSGIFQINLRKCWFKFPKNSFLIIKHLNLCHLFVRLIKKPQKKGMSGSYISVSTNDSIVSHSVR